MEYQKSLPKGSSLLKEAFELVKSKSQTLLSLSAIIFVMAILLEILFPSNADGSLQIKTAAAIVFFIAFIIAYAVLELLIQISMILVVDQNISTQDALNKSTHVFWPYAWTSLLSGLIIFGGFILLIIPGIIFAFWYCMFSYTVVLENLRGMAALRKSKEYIKGYIGQVLWRWIVLALITIVVFIPIALVQGYNELASAVVSGIVLLFYVPFAVAYQYLIYKHLKQIKTTAEPSTEEPRHEELSQPI
jgi:hypothetical protein